jgi:hypothetical protein
MRQDELHTYNGILSGVDTVLAAGDAAADPFNVLEVYKISCDNEFINVFNFLDIKVLYKETDCIDWVSHIEKLDGKSLISAIIDENTQENIIRLSWWICNQLLYHQETSPLYQYIIHVADNAAGLYENPFTSRYIDLTQIVRKKSQKTLCNQCKFYIYKSIDSCKGYYYNDCYVLEIMLPTGATMKIYYTNKLT